MSDEPDLSDHRWIPGVPEDIAELVVAMHSRGYACGRDEAEMLWRLRSHAWAATWMDVPRNDRPGLVAQMEPFFEHVFLRCPALINPTHRCRLQAGHSGEHRAIVEAVFSYHDDEEHGRIAKIVFDVDSKIEGVDGLTLTSGLSE